MKKNILFAALPLLCLAMGACKEETQTTEHTGLYYPLAFGSDTTNIRQDMMTRAYITPKRVLWQQGNVQGSEHLLEPNTGQADLAGSNMCFMQSTKDETASIILDFGRELHGGIKLVISSASAANFDMRLRFGESVSETCRARRMAVGYTSLVDCEQFTWSLGWQYL